jgi:phosphopantothenoylcysteine decarboxylase/phosphopantothenate--cysteine ligase
VTLITGPVSLKTPEGAIHRIDIESAQEMHDAVMKISEKQDIIIMSAAIADFTPDQKHEGKIKKGNADSMTVSLKKTTDILSALGKKKAMHQKLIGFALESDDALNYGKKKLNEKNCDMVIVNQANKPDSGFGGDNNTITIIDTTGNVKEFAPMSKDACAEAIIEHVLSMCKSE